MRRLLLALLLVALANFPANAQVFDLVNRDHLNRLRRSPAITPLIYCRQPDYSMASLRSTSIIQTRDEYNFDAEDQSFAWLAAQRGIGVELTHVTGGHHDLRAHIEHAAPSHPPTYG